MEEELADYDFYTLVCKTDENIYYIGSSSNSKDIIQKNSSNCNNSNGNDYNTKTYKIMRDNGGFDSFKFINLGNTKKCNRKRSTPERTRIYELI